MSAASSEASLTPRSSELLYRQISDLERGLRRAEARLDQVETQLRQQEGRLSLLERFFAGVRLLCAGWR